MQRERDGEVEAVVGSLINHDGRELGHAEIRQVDLVLGRREQVAQLAALRLKGDGVEELEEFDVRWVRAEVLAQQDVERGLEHEGVVDGDGAHAGLPVPARLAPSRDGAIHDVVGYEEEGLQELRQPAEGGAGEEVRIGEGGGDEDGGGVEDGDAAVVFAAKGIVVEGLGEVLVTLPVHEHFGGSAQRYGGGGSCRSTFSYHSRASEGSSYCWAWATRSLTREGQTDSKSARVYGIIN